MVLLLRSHLRHKFDGRMHTAILLKYYCSRGSWVGLLHAWCLHLVFLADHYSRGSCVGVGQNVFSPLVTVWYQNYTSKVPPAHGIFGNQGLGPQENLLTERKQLLRNTFFRLYEPWDNVMARKWKWGVGNGRWGMGLQFRRRQSVVYELERKCSASRPVRFLRPGKER